MIILSRAKEDGGLEMSDYQRASFKQYIKDNAGSRLRLKIEREVPESKHQRGFYHGAILALWAYLDGKDYKDTATLDDLHEVAKLEFNPDIIIVGGEPKKIGRSTKGKLNEGYLERLIDYLIEQYGIDPNKVLNPERYKTWRDTIYPFTTKYDSYLDYLLATGELIPR